MQPISIKLIKLRGIVSWIQFKKTRPCLVVMSRKNNFEPIVWKKCFNIYIYEICINKVMCVFLYMYVAFILYVKTEQSNLFLYPFIHDLFFICIFIQWNRFLIWTFYCFHNLYIIRSWKSSNGWKSTGAPEEDVHDMSFVFCNW